MISRAHGNPVNCMDLFGHKGLIQCSFYVSGEKVMQPYLCEVNFSPDLSVYEKKYPQLTNDIFSTLFLDDTEGRPVKLLSTS